MTQAALASTTADILVHPAPFRHRAAAAAAAPAVRPGRAAAIAAELRLLADSALDLAPAHLRGRVRTALLCLDELPPSAARDEAGAELVFVVQQLTAIALDVQIDALRAAADLLAEVL